MRDHEGFEGSNVRNSSRMIKASITFKANMANALDVLSLPAKSMRLILA